MSSPAPPVSVSLPAAPLRVCAAGTAGDQVPQLVADEALPGGGGAGQVLDIRGERVGCERRLDPVDALAGILGDGVAGIDLVQVVARAAGEPIGAVAAAQRIVAGAAVERVR